MVGDGLTGADLRMSASMEAITLSDSRPPRAPLALDDLALRSLLMLPSIAAGLMSLPQCGHFMHRL